MDETFWLKRWQQDRIGFHQPDINPWLAAHWPQGAQGERVLVPLCGKSLDMVWLAQQGYRVDGFELSAKAAAQFFQAQQQSYQITSQGPFKCYQQGPFRLFVGDFFAVDPHAERYTLAYDRAALIALPAAMQIDYVARLTELMAEGGQVLLITLEYGPSQQNEPPFSVDTKAIQRLFEPNFTIDCLGRQPQSTHPKRLTGQFSFIDEVAYLLTKCA